MCVTSDLGVRIAHVDETARRRRCHVYWRVVRVLHAHVHIHTLTHALNHSMTAPRTGGRCRPVLMFYVAAKSHIDSTMQSTNLILPDYGLSARTITPLASWKRLKRKAQIIKHVTFYGGRGTTELVKVLPQRFPGVYL